MTSTARRVVAATLTTMALSAPAVVSAQAAPPPHAAKHAKPEKSAKPVKPTRTDRTAAQLLRAIGTLDRALDRVAVSRQTTRLADDNEAALLANVVLDQALLAQLGEQVSVDAAVVRDELRAFRVTNYALAATILRQAEQIADEVPADPEAAAHLAVAVAKAHAITATSPMVDVKEARTALTAALDELEDDDTGEEAGS